MKDCVYFNSKGAEKGFFSHFSVFHLLQNLALRTNNDNGKWVVKTSYPQIAFECGLTNYRAKKNIKELIDRGYIIKKRLGNKLEVIVAESDLVRFSWSEDMSDESNNS